MILGKFLNPRNDCAFKHIFGKEKNKGILIHFLNDMLLFREQKPIVDVTFLKTIQDPEIASKKQSIVDVMCHDQDGNTYIVEMQVARSKGFEKRAQYYAAKAYFSQMNRAEEYHHLKEVIFLAITDFTMFPNKKAYKSDHVILDKETYENDLQGFSFTFLELPKFKKSLQEFERNLEDLESMLEKWAYFFLYAEKTTDAELQQILENTPVIGQALKELDRFSWSEEELLAYEQEAKSEADERAILAQKYDEGEAKGRAEGLHEGMEKGKAEGLHEGMEKGMEKGKIEKALETAKAMLEKDLPLEMIAEITKLDLDTIRKLVS